MDDSKYVLCILAEEYRAIIDQEIRRALYLYEAEEVLFILKNNKESMGSWYDLLTNIHAHYKVKYTEHLDNRDFEIKFTRRLMVLFFQGYLFRYCFFKFYRYFVAFISV